MAFFQLKKEQLVQASLDDVWDFISSPKNLKEITPEHMGFNITSGELAEKMYPGMIISYKVSPILGLKLDWVTEITHVKDRHFFVDEQRVGPYKLWHHQHILKETTDGVLMNDIVTYAPPLGILGSIANTLFIRNQLENIFTYRELAMDMLFPKNNNFTEAKKIQELLA